MQDKYGCDNDGLSYPGSRTLINRLDIRDADKLALAERDISASCAANLEFSPPPYDLQYLSSIHRELFGDIYSWAGELRHVDISKGTTHFCHARYLEKEAVKVFRRLAEHNYLDGLSKPDLIASAAQFYGDINLKTAVKVPKSTQPLGTPRKFQKSQPTNQVDSIF